MTRPPIAASWVSGVHVVSAAVLLAASTLLVVVAAVVAAVGVWRAWRAARSPQLIMGDLTDGIGDARGLAEGLSQRVRESLLDALGEVFARARGEVERARGTAVPLGELMVAQEPKLLDDLNQSQQELTSSITAFAPGPSRPALQLALGTLLRARGTRVTGVLQLRGTGSGDVGLSFAINDLSPGQQASRFTLWESPDSDTSNEAQAARFHALSRPAAVMLSCELLRRRLLRSAPRANWLERGRYGQATADLVARRDRYNAAVNMLSGILYQVSARRMTPATTSFYERSCRALEQALRWSQFWRTYEVLGDSLAEYARRLPEQGRSIEMFASARSRYDEALAGLRGSGLPEDAMLADRDRIHAARAITLALLAERSDTPPCQALIDWFAVIDAVDGFEGCNPSLLYGWACAYAVAHRAGIGVADAGAKARRFLVLCWARDDSHGWWDEAKLDPDLSSVMPGAVNVQMMLEQRLATLHSDSLELLPADVDRLLEDTSWDAEPAPAHPAVVPKERRYEPKRR